MKKYIPSSVMEGNVYDRYDFLLSSVLIQACWILLLYLFMHTSAYANTSILLNDGTFLQTEMCDNVIEGGEISGDEKGCDDPVFDPTIISNVTLPSGGSGTLEYLWIFTTDDPEGEFSVWTPIMNTNTISYNPPAITETTHYRRCARRSGCEDYVAESNYVTKEVACCDNVDDGGSIQVNQTFCGNTYDPEPLTNLALPTGGSGELEYLWFESTVGPPFLPDSPNWIEIIGSNSMNFDPGPITQTTYYIRCSRRAGCTTFTGESNIIRIILSTPPALNVTATPPSCAGANDGRIALQVVNGASPFSYSWTGGIGNISNPTNLSAGTYAVTVTDANDCVAMTSVILNDPNLIQLTLNSTDIDCGDNNNGTASVSATGGTSPYTYQWDDPNNSTTSTINNLAEGTYRVTITDRNGCIAMGSTNVEETPAFDLTFTKTDVDCFNQNTGAATVNTIGGNAPFEYQWNDVNNQSTATAINLEAGSYFVSVTDANNCLTIGNVMIEQPMELNVALSTSPATCDNGLDGTATATPSGGTTPYTYLWDDVDRQTTMTAEGLSPGTYRVAVTDANGCINKSQITVGGAAGFEVKVTTADASCGNPNSGSAMAVVNTGSGSYAYLWNNNLMTPTINNLSAGTYTVTVTDRETGCTSVASGSVEATGDLELNFITTNISCNGRSDGQIRSEISNGQPPYTYLWSNNATSPNLSNLSVGTYALTVVDNNGCQAVRTTTVTQPAELIATTSTVTASCDSNNGEIAASVGGGTAPYTFRWNDTNNQTTQVATNVVAGTYTVTVTDARGCITTATGTVQNNSSPVITIDVNNATCGDSNGSATANVNSGTSPYTYQWNDSNNQTTRTANNLAVGTYTLTVTDANGCTATEVVTIQSNSDLKVSVTTNDAICGDANGSATANASGGTSPYTYRWNDTNNQTTRVANNLTGGTYTVTVTDANGCTATEAVTIQSNSDLKVSVTTNDAICGDANGSATANASGGTSPYTYRWNDTNNQTTRVANNLTGGTYTVTVIDANGCTTTGTATIQSAAELTVTTTTNDAVCGDANGNATANVSGGTAPYTYRWNDTNNQTTRVANNLASGTYTVTVIDVNGCTTTGTATIQSAAELTVTTTTNDAVCGDANGSATANVSGGTAPYAYRWNDTNNQTTRVANNLVSGTYIVTVTDANGCTATAISTVDETPALSVNIEETDATCGNSNGKAAAAISGGTSPYTFLWSDNQTTSTALNLAEGTYSVTVTDANGCKATATTTIEDGNPITATIMPGATSICSNESVEFRVTPNASNYTYQWSATGGTFNNTTVANPTYSMMTPGTYTITVMIRRDDGCEAMASTTVTVNARPTVEIQPPSPNLCDGGSIDFVADATGDVDGLVYEWSATGGVFNDNTLAEPTYTMTEVGTYTISLMVRNSSGCTASAQTTVTINEAPTCDAYVVSDYGGLDISFYNGNDGIASVNVAGGSGNYTYRWSNGTTMQTASGLTPGNYRVTVTDGNTCQCISSVQLFDAAKLGNFVWNDLDEDGIQDINEPGIPNVLVTLTGTDINGNEVTRSVRTDGDGMYMFDSLVPGDYKVTFTQPDGFRPTIQNQGTNDTTDSDIDPTTGMTQVVTLDYGEYNETLDAGYFDSGVNVGDYVFIDSNRNGIQDETERGLSDVILVLIDLGNDQIYGTGDDTPIDQTSTDFFGFYLFRDVPPGKYVIQIIQNSLPRDYQYTTQNAGTNDDIDSDFNPNTGISDMFMVMDSQADDLTHDAGVYGECNNVTDPGEIAADEDVCGAGNIPSLITDVRSASGGGGALEYIWLQSNIEDFQGLTDPNWSIIPGATGATYQPGQIFQTTYYIRCARRENCPDYRETNIVQKKIVPYPNSDLESGSTNVCTNETTTYVAEIGGFNNVTYDWHFGDNAVPQTASGRSVTVRWTSPGAKIISLNVIQDGCANYTTYEINVTSCPGLLGNFNTVQADLTPNAEVDLMWITNTEPQNSNYVIQRANADGTDFKSIDLMPAKGGSEVYTYHCVDKKPHIGKNYYRVKHFDLLGGFVYSNIVEVNVQASSTKDIIVYPNPFRDRTTLQIVDDVETDVIVQLVSAYGQVVDIQTVPIGTNYYDLDLTVYPKGVYYAYITYNGYRKEAYILMKTDDN